MLTAKVDAETYQGWHLWARSRGVTVTALIEAIGREVERHDEPDDRLPPWLRRAVRDAREIDGDRRRR